MTTKVKGTEGIEFPDSTVQASAGYTKAEVNVIAVPAGAIMDFAMGTPPVGWLSCDGALVSRATYAALFAAIGTTWGAGDGTTTFQLPDMRGYFRRSVGTNSDGSAAGAFATKQTQEVQTHAHLANQVNVSTSIQLGSSPYWVGNGTSTATVATGGSETRPRNIAVLTCIKT